MKTCALFIFLSTLFLSCSDYISVRTDHDKEVDIRKFPTFAILDREGIEARNNPLYYNELNDKRIKSAIVSELQGRGFVMDEANPALRVHYHIVIENKTQIINDSYTSYWIDTHRDSYRYREGTLIVDLMDASKEVLLWRSWATSVLNEKEPMSDELIRSAVSKMLKELPQVGKAGASK